MHFDTSELFQAYLTGLEDGRSVPLDQLAEPPAWVQGRLLADRDPRFMSARDMAKRPDLSDFETRVYTREILKSWQPISASLASIAAQQSADFSRLLQGVGGIPDIGVSLRDVMLPSGHWHEQLQAVLSSSLTGLSPNEHLRSCFAT